MSETIKQTITMLEMLPDQEQSLALEIVKRLVLAWDPDFTKLTPEERRRLEAAENGEYLDLEDDTVHPLSGIVQYALPSYIIPHFGQLFKKF